MRAAIFIPQQPEIHVTCLKAMREGLRKKGILCDAYPLEEGCTIPDNYDFSVSFGVKKLAIPDGLQRGKVQEVYQQRALILEVGYLKRDQYFQVGWGGLNGHAEFYNAESPDDRWEQLNIELAPWRKTGEHIILCGQVPWDAAVQNLNHVNWLQESLQTLSLLTKREIIFRPHPKIIDPSIYGIDNFSINSLESDLQNAWAVVTHNSNTAIEAIIKGIPAIACDKGSMIYNFSSNHLDNIESPLTPNREPHLNNIAYAQWNLTELSNGIAWEHIKQGLAG